MFITTYKVTSPQVIEEFVEDLKTDKNSVIVHVDMMAICKADIRYFLGNRDVRVLERKYPLAPIHEAVGRVIKDPTGTYKKGDKVILVPNFVDHLYCNSCKETRCHRLDLGENYCPHAVFKSSSADGFMKQFYSCDPELLVKFDSDVGPEIAVWSELLSVSVAACRRIDFDKTNNIAIFGDGIMGYMVYLIITYLYHKEVTIFGPNKDKLDCFKHAKTSTFEEYQGDNFDTLIECVGGKASSYAINQMIDIATIGADLILMGVSEENIPINTRKVLEKGISLKGVTRSTREDFVTVSSLLSNKSLQNELKPLILSISGINSVNDIYNCFNKEINNKTIIGKNLMKF